jgi:hypothetical protein
MAELFYLVIVRISKMDFLSFNLCSPAYYYLIFSLVLIIIFVLVKIVYSILFKMDILKFLIIKLVTLVFFIFALNTLCNNNLTGESWALMVILMIGWCFTIIPNLLPSFK